MFGIAVDGCGHCDQSRRYRTRADKRFLERVANRAHRPRPTIAENIRR
jgi:hypothetical protein